jgi:hypothetical protein
LGSLEAQRLVFISSLVAYLLKAIASGGWVRHRALPLREKSDAIAKAGNCYASA